MVITAFAPVARFHSLEEITLPESSKTLNAAVFGPEVPWFKAIIEILFIPTSRGMSKPWYPLLKVIFLMTGISFSIMVTRSPSGY